MDAIVTEDLHKRYKTVQALDGVSFSVREGEVFGLLGPNGAGKSTSVRVLTTLTKPDSGRALVAGEDVVRHPNRVRRMIGYVAQDSGVDWEATGRENLCSRGGSMPWRARSCTSASTSCSGCSGSWTRPTASRAATRAA